MASARARIISYEGRHAVVAVDEHTVLSLGGMNTGWAADVDSVYAYDVPKGDWATLPPLPNANWGVCGAVDEASGLLYATEYTTAQHLHVYAVGSSAWSALPAAPVMQTGGSCAFYNGHFHLVGGEYLTDHYAYEASTSTWASKPAHPVGRRGAVFAQTDGVLYTGAGNANHVVDPTYTRLTDFWSYEFSTSAWASLPDMPTGTVWSGAAALPNHIAVPTGSVDQYCAPCSAEVQLYTISTSTWSSLPSLPRIVLYGSLASVVRGDGWHLIHTGGMVYDYSSAAYVGELPYALSSFDGGATWDAAAGDANAYWSPQPEMPASVRYAGGGFLTLGDDLYVALGTNTDDDSVNTDSLQRYRLRRFKDTDHYASCFERLSAGYDSSGTYAIAPGGAGEERFQVYCDMVVDGGGWTLVGASYGGTLNDYGGAYYSYLAGLSPPGAVGYLWNGLYDVIAAASHESIRFSCNAAGYGDDFTVDIAFYDTTNSRSIPDGDTDQVGSMSMPWSQCNHSMGASLRATATRTRTSRGTRR